MTSIRLGIDISSFSQIGAAHAGPRSPFIASAFTYERAAPPDVPTDVLTARISRAYKTSTGDALTFVFQRDGVQVASVTSPQYASNDEPGARSGSGQSLSALTESLTVGKLYMITYEVSVNDSGATIFPFGLSPFEDLTGDDFPSTVGWHTVFGVAKNTNTQAVVYTTGDITIPHFNVQDAQASIDVPASWVGDLVSYQITSGNETAAKRAFTVPSAGTVYVHPTNGSDDFGVGSQLSPYKSMSAAFAAIGDGVGGTIIKRPGFYDPYEVPIEGADGSPLRITHMPGEKNLAIVLGDVDQHVSRGGAGVAQNNATRDGIRIDGKSYVEIDGIAVHKVWRNGIFVKGAGADTVTSNIKITNCVTDDTGLSGIYVCGEVAGSPVPANDAFRTRYVYVEDNDVTKTNTVNDWNYDQINSEGERGGVGEAITVANSVQYIYVRRNHVHNSRQYGIDFKNHVVDGEISGNRIDEVTRYAIYLDSGELDVRRILVANNRMSNCRAGLVLAREEDGNDSGDDLVMEDIDIVNNVTWNMSRVGMHFQRHPTKDQQNIGYFRRIRARFNSFFNTNTDGIYRDINIDDIAGFGNNIAGDPIVSGIELIGNVAWNPDGSMRMAIDVAGDSRFTVEQNYNVQDGTFTGTDPLYVDLTADEPDFSLGEGSGAKDIVTTASYIAAPFDKFADGTDREIPTNAGSERTSTFRPISTNLNGINDFAPGTFFLNRVRQARIQALGDVNGVPALMAHDAAMADYTDADGWVHSLPPDYTNFWILFAWSGFEASYHQVPHDIKWEGAESISPGNVDNWTKIGTNHYRFTPRMAAWWMNFTHAPGASGDYIRNVQIYRTQDAALVDAGEMFNPDFLDLCRGMKELRFMDWQETNRGSLPTVDVPRANYASFNRYPVAPEVIARLCNETDADPWVCMHHTTGPTHWAEFARRLAADLDTARTVKVTYSNETWNFGFDVHDHDINAAQTLWSGGANDYWQDDYYGYQLTRILPEFEKHFPRNRIKLVLETQSENTGLTERRLAAQAWQDSGDTAYIAPSSVIDEIAVTTYLGSQILSDVAYRTELLNVIDTQSQADAFDWLTRYILTDTPDGAGQWSRMTTGITSHKTIADREGVALTLYEGGQHVHHSFSVGIPQAQMDILTPFLSAFVDTEHMAALYQKTSDFWLTVSSNEPLMQFGVVGAYSDSGSWSLIEGYDQTYSPRAELIFNGYLKGGPVEDYTQFLSDIMTAPTAIGATVTVAAQPSTLNGFPVPVDLSEMNDAAWAALRSDGGNLRAKSADLATDYPLDVSYIDKIGKKGRAWVRTNLSDSAATTFVLDVQGADVTAVASDAATGREAVWTGYAAAVSLPEKINRVDGAAIVHEDALTSGIFVREYSQDAARQGVAYGASGERFAFDTGVITKFAADWTTQTAINTTPLANQQAALSHVGDGCVVGTELFTANSKYPGFSTPTSEVAVYETSDLTFKRSYNITSTAGLTALSSICYNDDDDLFYLTCYETPDEIFVFNSSFVQQTSITLASAIADIQGITYKDGQIFLSHNIDGLDTVTQVTQAGEVVGVAATSSSYGQGLDISEEGYLVVVGTNTIFEWDISQGPAASAEVMYSVTNIGTQAAWTLSATSLASGTGDNQQIAGFNLVSSSSTRGGMFIRSNNEYESWASGENWMSPSPAVTRDTANKRHMTLTFDGTASRNLFLDGDAYASDSGIAGTFTTSALNLIVGGNGTSSTADMFKGSVFDVLFHESVRSDDWIKAEADALLDPATFAVLTSR